MKAKLHILGLSLVFLFSLAAKAQESMVGASMNSENFDEKAALDYSQAVIGNKVGDYVFRDSDGNEVRLSDFEGKPVVISLIYTSCYHTCPLITQNIRRAISDSDELVSPSDYQVLTIGFDTRVDSPGKMKVYAREQGITYDNWMVLSADATTIAKLSEDLGFIYFPSPRGFDHLAQTTILGSDRAVYRQLYGATFDPPFLAEPLRELVYGIEGKSFNLDTLVQDVKLFCTYYDPKSGRYRFDYSLFVGLFVGLLSLGAIATFFIREVIRRRKA